MSFSALLLFAQIASAQALPEEITYRDLTVIDVSTHPPDSGILHTFVGIVGRLKTGETLTFKLTFGSEGQPIPPVASLCTFKGHATLVRSTMSGPPERVIEIASFDCTISSESPFVPPPKMRVRPYYG